MQQPIGVIFDMDGTLVDSEVFYLKTFTEMCTQMGIEITPEEHASFFGTSIEAVWNYLIPKYDIRVPFDELVNQVGEGVYKNILASQGGAAMPGVIDLLKKFSLVKIPLALGTSAPQNLMEATLSSHDLLKFFPIRVTVSDTGISKPAPDIFLLAAKKLGLHPNQCAVFEDSYNGVLAAKKAGMKAIGYLQDGKNMQDLSQADWKFNRYDEITFEKIRELF